MDRVLRTITTGVGTLTAFYVLLTPGGLGRRLVVGLGAAALGMGVFLGAMTLSNLPLQAGYLQGATLLALLGILATVEVPARMVAALQGIPPATSRGVTILGMVVACFLAAWAAGLPEIPDASHVGAPQGRSEVARGRP